MNVRLLIRGLDGLWLVLAFANLVLLAALRPTTENAATTGDWAAWTALAPNERQVLVERYQRTARSPEERNLLGRARQFRQRPEQEQELIRELQTVLRTTLSGESPARRRDLLLSSPRARAFAIHELLKSSSPAQLRELAARARPLCP
jgi:hypothetical protein